MPLRVTQQSVARAALAGIRRAADNLGTLQERLATSRRINRPSDAPLDAARARRLHAHTARLEQYGRNVDQAQHQIELAAATLQQVSDIFVEARDLCVRGANAATEPGEREALAFATEQLLESLLLRANAEYEGRYLFAGSASDAPPYAEELDGGDIASVAYRGDNCRVELDVGPRARVETGEPGTSVFGAPGDATGAFDALIELRDLLRNPEGLSSGELSQALSDHIGQLSAAHDRVVDAAARFGWRSTQLESARTVVDNRTLRNAELTSALEDADYVEDAASLYRQEAALEAALVMAARMVKISLLEYLQ